MNDPYSGTNMQCLSPSEVQRIVKERPVAYVPVGTLEWHGIHLPLGVDALVPYALLSRTAAVSGGVVLPPLYTSCGLLNLPYCFSYRQSLLGNTIKETLEQIRKEGFRAIIVMTGHGPMDQIHIIKSVCQDLSSNHADVEPYGLCWFELLVDTGEDLIIDHAAKVETSLMQELWPDLVDLSQLNDDPNERYLGVYGPNPKFTASKQWGDRMAGHIVKKLSERVDRLLAGSRIDPYADLRDFVKKYWSQPLEIRGGHRTSPLGTEFDLFNNSAYSRYISSLLEIKIDGKLVPLENVRFKNPNPGEYGRWQLARNLSPSRGFYIRRQQSGTVLLKKLRLSGESHKLYLRFQLAGVTDSAIEATLMPAAPTS